MPRTAMLKTKKYNIKVIFLQKQASLQTVVENASKSLYLMLNQAGLYTELMLFRYNFSELWTHGNMLGSYIRLVTVS